MTFGTIPSGAVALTQELVRCPSVTPETSDVFDVLEARLQASGFRCWRLPFGIDSDAPADNLYARIGKAEPNLCFAGHLDVVPIGDESAWSRPPFAGHIEDGRLWGRGVSDMKGAIAAFVVAAEDHFSAAGGIRNGSISLLITGDEEGPAKNGTIKVLDWLRERGEQIEGCLVGEPTNPEHVGQTIKIGRRGSLNVRLTVSGQQGHVAYPHRADNSVPKLLQLLAALPLGPFDDGNEFFEPSNLEVTSLETGANAFNVIPGRAEAMFNVRFNTLHTGEEVIASLRTACEKTGLTHELDFALKGEPFLTAPGPLSQALEKAIHDEIGDQPELATGGGTSDARYIKDYCPVVEFGLVSKTIHAVDEYAFTKDIDALKQIYGRLIALMLDGPAA